MTSYRRTSTPEASTARSAGRPGVESHDHRLGGRRQEHVGLVDVAGALAEDVDPGSAVLSRRGVADGNEPWTSVFRMTRSSLTSAAWIWALMSSRLAAELAARRSDPRRRREQPSRRPPPAAGRRPRRSGAGSRPRSPARPASPVGRPRSEGADAEVLPTVTISPTFSVPVWTRTVATLPRPLSTLDSMIVP